MTWKRTPRPAHSPAPISGQQPPDQPSPRGVGPRGVAMQHHATELVAHAWH